MRASVMTDEERIDIIRSYGSEIDFWTAQLRLLPYEKVVFNTDTGKIEFIYHELVQAHVNEIENILNGIEERYKKRAEQ